MEKLIGMLVALSLMVSLAATCWAIDTEHMKQENARKFRQVVTVVIQK